MCVVTCVVCIEVGSAQCIMSCEMCNDLYSVVLIEEYIFVTQYHNL